MTARVAVAGVALVLWSACTFRPDYSRYPPCSADGGCAVGALCFSEENRCLPACGERPAAECASNDDAGEEDAGIVDAGFVEDAGAEKDGGVQLFGTALENAVEGDPYSHAFSADGGEPPYVFAATGLPDGLSLESGSGVLSGVAGDAGTFAFTVRVDDSAQDFDARQVSLKVQRRLRLASGGMDDGGTRPLSDADNGVQYSEQLYATGGVGAVTWAVDGGALPSGLTLSSGGEISGTTAANGTFTVVVQDEGPPVQTRARTYSITVRSLGLTLHMLTQSVPLGRVGEPYTYKLTSGGGTGAHTWTFTGTLPPGVTLKTDTLSGTPTTAGDFTFTLKVSDTTLGNVQRTFTAHVDP